jgi:hypothetical protein
MAKTSTPVKHNEGVSEFASEPSVFQLILIVLGTLTAFFIFIYNVSP